MLLKLVLHELLQHALLLEHELLLLHDHALLLLHEVLLHAQSLMLPTLHVLHASQGTIGNWLSTTTRASAARTPSEKAVTGNCLWTFPPPPAP